MTNRPRSHQLEDQGRFALGRALPPHWTIETVVHDYGLDSRVEIFSASSRPTGHFFFVQLKCTDRVPTKGGISIRLRPAHLSYWNRLPVPTIVMLWVAPTDKLYWRWSHHHHPWPRLHTPKMETFRLTASDRWEPADADAVVDEVEYCAQARGGRLSAPIELYLERHPAPIGDVERHQFVRTWTARVDPRVATISAIPKVAQSRVTLGNGAFQIRLGRMVTSLAVLPGGDKIGPDELVGEVASTLGMMLCSGDNMALGVALIAAHGADSRLLMISTGAADEHGRSNPLPSPQLLLSEAARFDVILDLAEAWLTPAHDTVSRGAATAMLAWLKACDARMSSDERDRMNRLLASVPYLAPMLRPELGLSVAEFMHSAGRTRRALEQYNLITGGADNASRLADRELERLSVLHRAVGEYDCAVDCLKELIKRHPGNERWRLDFGICSALAGSFAAAMPGFLSIVDAELHGEAWCWAMTATLAGQAAGSYAQTRDPAAAARVARRVDDGASADLIILQFREAASLDALSYDTWRLYFKASLRSQTDQLPYGGIGILPVALLAWHDPEWWALVLTGLLQHGQAEAGLRGSECALQAIGTEFPTMLDEGNELEKFAAPALAGFVRHVAALKQGNRPLRITDDVIDCEGHRHATIEVAPAGHRLFDVDLPPSDQWFRDGGTAVPD